MKKFHYKRKIPQEETPILQLLERSHTLLYALAHEVNSESHELTTRTKSSNMASSGSYRDNLTSLGSDEGTPSLVIKDTDLASSWIYSKKKAAANSVFESVSSEPMSPVLTMSKQDSRAGVELSPQLEFKRIPIAPRVRSKSTCCCYMTILLIIFICLLGILTSVGGILYLEVFTKDRKPSTADLNFTPTQTSISYTTDFEHEHQQKPSTETNNPDVVTNADDSSSTTNTFATANINLLQARRGNWGNDVDDRNEFPERTLESTTDTDNLQSTNKALLSTYSDSSMNGKIKNSKPTISNSITDAEPGLITDKTFKLTNKLKVDDLLKKSTTITPIHITKSVNTKNTTDTKSNQATVNLNAFQARRGNWANDYDDDDEFSKGSLESTTLTDNFKGTNNGLLSTYSETNVNDKITNLKTSISDRIIDTKNGPITDKTIKIINELKADDLSQKFHFTAATTNRITKRVNGKNTTDTKNNPDRLEDDFVNSSGRVPKNKDFNTDLSTTVKLQLITTPEIHTNMLRNLSNGETTSEISLSKRPFAVTAVKLDESKNSLPDSSSSKSSGKDIFLEPTHLNKENTFTSATSLKFSPNLAQSTRRPKRNKLDDLQENMASILRHLKRLDTHGTLPHSRMKDLPSQFKASVVRQIGEDSAESVFPALAEKEREKYLDKLRDIYFSSQEF